MNYFNNKIAKEKGFLKGILYGILPHTFCIAFIVFSILGATIMTSFLKPLLLNSYFFYILIGLSFIFATISAIFYLKKNGILSFQGVKRKWKYLSTLYGTTIFINLLFFMVIFPAMVNVNSKFLAGDITVKNQNFINQITLEVSVPCTGHAPLIIDELKKVAGIENIKFRAPNLFDINYDITKTSQEKILSLEIFNTFKATIIK